MPDANALRGRITLARSDCPAVVFAHGFGSNSQGEKAASFEEECSRRGWAFAACDFTGHGSSDGTMLDLSGARLIEDLEAITRAVSRQIHGPIFLVGSSMGGWTSAWVAANEPELVRGCAFIAPAFHFLEWQAVGEAERAEWQRTGKLHVHTDFLDTDISYALYSDAEKFPYEALVASFSSPLIMFHGMQDTVVPCSGSSDFLSRCSTETVELMLFKTGDHRLTDYKQRISRAACDFFDAALREP